MANSDFTIYNKKTGQPIKTGYADVDLMQLAPWEGLILRQIDLQSQLVDLNTGEVVDKVVENG